MHKLSLMSACAAVALAALSDPIQVKIDVTTPGHAVPDSLWGIFLEDIAMSVDGCLYPELVLNRGFDFRPAPSDPGFERRAKGPMDLGIPGWENDFAQNPGTNGRITLQYARPKFEDNPAYLRIEAFAPYAGVKNSGQMGEMRLQAGERYRVSLWARGDGPVAVRVKTQGDKGKVLWGTEFKDVGSDWKRFEAEFALTEASPASLGVYAVRKGTVELEQVSLKPVETYKGHGLRKDVAQLIADLKPANFRFPGGCMLESYDYSAWWDWKRTLGEPGNRQPLWNIWGYYQLNGLGFYEYFRFAEDIGAEPLPVFIGGRTCQFRNSQLWPMSSLDDLARNILDAIEFARGDASTKWGAVRASMGHPAPFRLKTIGIGNENWGKEYFKRYYALAAKVREAHPDIKIIAAIDPHVILQSKRGEESWAMVRKGEVDFADEHMYGSPSYWLNHCDRYDGYPRDGVPVYIGEWGTKNVREDWLDGHYVALSEAAFRIGIEKNSDVVKMVAYAPLARRFGAPRDGFALLKVTSDGVYGNPTYYAEKMFTDNRPERVLPVSYPKVTSVQPAGWEQDKGRFNPENKAVEVVSFHAGAGLTDDGMVVKLVNAGPEARDVELLFDADLPAGRVTRTTLAGEPGARNTFAEPKRHVPVVDEFRFDGGSRCTVKLQPYSFVVLRGHAD